MVVYVYQDGKRERLLDPQVYIAGARVPVQVIWAYTGGERHLVFARTPVTLTASAAGWDRAVLTWTAPGPGADSYRLYRSATPTPVLVYSGPALTFTDTGLLPVTGYGWKVEALRGGAVVGEATATATTAALTFTPTTTSPRWDQITITTNVPTGSGIARVRVYRVGTTSALYEGTAATYTDVSRRPSTSYNYRIEAVSAAGTVVGTATCTGTTGPLNLTLTAAAQAWNQVGLTWTAPDGIDRFYLAPIGHYGSASRAATHTGLAASSAYHYRLDAERIGEPVLAQAWASATTPARPTNTGSVNGPTLISSGGWTWSSARTLNGPLFTLWNAYVSSFNLFLGGEGRTAAGDFDPFVGGTRLGWRDVPNGKAWRHVDGGNVYVNGQFRVGAYVGGGGRKATAWQAYQGVSWDYNVACGTLNYWWYAGRAADPSPQWWREEFADQEIHVESWVDVDGNTTRVVVSEREDHDAVLYEWEADQ